MIGERYVRNRSLFARQSPRQQGGSGQPLSPGARSNPSRTDAQQGGIVRGVHAELPRATKHSEPAPGEPPAAQAKVVGPED